MAKGKIRVMVIDDSSFFRFAVSRALTADPRVDVVGDAPNPYDARDKIVELDPDVIVLDIEMPEMDGVEFLKILLPQWKVPVIVVSSSRRREDAALKSGAVAFLQKPDARAGEGMNRFTAELIQHIVKIVRPQEATAKNMGIASPLEAITGYKFSGLIALGASTGGTQSTAKILRELPGDIPGMVVVQHMPPDFTRMYSENLDRECALAIREARDGEKIERGTVLICPGDRHMEIVRTADSGYGVRLSSGPKVNGHRPSVDVLFSSVARIAGRNAMGIILTGMGGDGAQGLLEMRRRGAFTIGQDEKTSVVYGMPKVAYDVGAVVRQCPLETIAGVMMKYIRDLRA